jgi:hypothetical protein
LPTPIDAEIGTVKPKKTNNRILGGVDAKDIKDAPWQVRIKTFNNLFKAQCQEIFLNRHLFNKISKFKSTNFFLSKSCTSLQFINVSLFTLI